MPRQQLTSQQLKQAKALLRQSNMRNKRVPRSYKSSSSYGGRGAYYVQGGLYGRAKLGPVKAGGALQAGYSSGTVNIPTIKGLGSYKVENIRHNVFMSDPPMIKNARSIEGATVIRHREYLGPIISSTVAGQFKIQSYALNPAQSQSFPWLSSIAQNYEEYRPNGVMYEFKSTCSDAIASSTNLALGQIMLATRYDPTDPPFASDIEMLNYEFAQSGKVSDNVCHYVECDTKQSPLTHLYTRPGSAGGDQDLRFSDFGTFYIASSGLQGTSVQLGQLWVSFEFLLYKPKIASLQSTPTALFKWYNPSITSSAPLGAGVFQYNAENDVQATVSANIITFPQLASPVTWLVVINWAGFTAMSSQFNSLTLTNCVRVKAFNNNASGTGIAPQASLTGTTNESMVMYISTNANTVPNINFANNVAFTGAGYVDGCITQVAYLDPAIYGSV